MSRPYCSRASCISVGTSLSFIGNIWPISSGIGGGLINKLTAEINAYRRSPIYISVTYYAAYAHVCVIVQLLSRSAPQPRVLGEEKATSMELAVRLSSSRRFLYRRADGIKRSHSTRIQWALRALPPRILLVFSFFFSPFSPFFSLFPFPRESFGSSFAVSRRIVRRVARSFAEACLHKEIT